MSSWISFTVMFICLRETDRFLTGTLQTLSSPTPHLFQHSRSNTGIRCCTDVFFFLHFFLSCLSVRVTLKKTKFASPTCPFSFCVWVGRWFWVHGQSPNGTERILVRPSGTRRGFGYQTQHCSETGPIHSIWWVSQSRFCCLWLYFGVFVYVHLWPSFPPRLRLRGDCGEYPLHYPDVHL